MPRAMILACLLAACSTAPERAPGPVPTERAGPAPDAPTPARTPAPQAPSADPRPGDIKTFGDWSVGCDNLRNCKAVALAPENSAGDWPPFLLSVERDAGAAGALRIVVSGQAELVTPISVAVDGRTVAAGGRVEGAAFTGDAARRIAAALTVGRRARITAGATIADNSLAGASAALRYIDAQQGRAGTTGALVARGPAPDRSVAGKPPVIRALTPTGTPARLTPAQEATLRKTAGCTIADFTDDIPRAETHALGGGTTLVLLPCDRGAYNAIAALFVIPRGGRPVPARLDAETGMNPDPQPVASVINADFENGVLSTYAKGRGLGDCGTTQSFVWDGQRLRLTEMTAMSECRGSIDYIPIWRATVAR